MFCAVNNKMESDRARDQTSQSGEDVHSVAREDRKLAGCGCLHVVGQISLPTNIETDLPFYIL